MVTESGLPCASAHDSQTGPWCGGGPSEGQGLLGATTSLTWRKCQHQEDTGEDAWLSSTPPDTCCWEAVAGPRGRWVHEATRAQGSHSTGGPCPMAPSAHSADAPSLQHLLLSGRYCSLGAVPQSTEAQVSVSGRTASACKYFCSCLLCAPQPQGIPGPGNSCLGTVSLGDADMHASARPVLCKGNPGT